ncbi:MAG: hypothetical protein KQH79_11265 [Bacteroidetes bacterium]|nr:hypothetical protein [Bacteroidota bacterium]
MKKIILVFVTVFISGTVFMNCQSSSEKVDQAKENVVEATNELNHAIRDSIVQFKKVSEQKINDNEQKIAELKAKIATEKNEIKVISEKRLAELEQKNTDLQKKLSDFNEEQVENWDSFKEEFSGDMNDLGTALKNFVVKD